VRNEIIISIPKFFLLFNIVSSNSRKCFPFMLCVQSSLIRIPDHVRQIFNIVEAVFNCIRLCFLPGWSASVSDRRDRWCCFLIRGTGANCCSWPNLGQFCADQRACQHALCSIPECKTIQNTDTPILLSDAFHLSTYTHISFKSSGFLLIDTLCKCSSHFF
jgi:hypothetical protein